MNFNDAAQIDALAKMPPAPVRREGRGIWGSAWDSLKVLGHESTANVLEVMKPFGAALATTMEADPRARAAVGAEAARAGAEEGRRQIATGEAMDFTPGEMSKPSRAMADALKPDMATASRAEQVVFGLVGPAVGLVGSALLAGPGGLAVAAASLGFSQSEELRKQDVDLGTRSAVGGVTAAVTAVGGVLPLFGPTVAKTLGLYALGGPGAFVAQQLATRSILERADYGEIAKQYDPLDTTGLLLSALIPLPFAAAGLARNLRAGAKAPARPAGAPAAADQAPTEAQVAPRPSMPQEAVDAAMVHNLTLARGVRERLSEVDRAEFARQANESPIAEMAPAERANAVDQLGDPRQVSMFDGPRPDAADLTGSVVNRMRGVSDEQLGEDVAPQAQPVRALPEPDLGRLAESFAAAKAGQAEFAAHLEAGGTLDSFLAGKKLPDAARNMLIGLYEAAGNPKRVQALAEAIAKRAQEGKSDRDATADAVESVRALTEDQLAGIDKPPKPSADPLLQSVANRVAELEATQPGLVVRLDADGNPVTVAEELATIRREAIEGSDTELGLLDADLLRVAADCALST